MNNNIIDVLLTQKILPSPVKCFGAAEIHKISQTICAFLNSQGGWIIIGVDRDKNVMRMDIDGVIEELQSEVTNNIAPLPLVYIHKERYKNDNVVLVTVIKGSLPPYSYKGKYYIMVGNEIILPSADQISTLLRNSFSIKSAWESIVNLLSSPDNLDLQLMNEVYKQGLSSHKLSVSSQGLLTTLSELQLMDSYEVKNGAVCLFATDISHSVPQSRVRIQLMLKGKTSEKFDHTLTVEGNILVLLRTVIDYLSNLLPRQSLFIESDIKRLEVVNYPVDVLREAIGNALIHRDYSDSVGEVSVFIYPNRLEIRNPGRLPKNLVKGKSEILPHGSVLRNPLMAEIFYIGGYMEKTGRGMELISRKMKELGSRPPEWITSNGYTTLTLYNEEAKTSYNDRIKSFLSSFKSNETFTKKDYIEFFEKQPSKITAQSDILRMMELGICEKIGKGPATKYKLIDRY